MAALGVTEFDRVSAILWYLDGNGIRWHAYERRRVDRLVLVFESASAIRLVRDYPDNWDTLPVRALEALSWCV